MDSNRLTVGCGPLSTLLFLFLAAAPTPVSAEEPLTLGVYLPATYIGSSVEKATFLSGAENALSEALGTRVVASFSDPTRMAKIPLWLTEAAEVAISKNAIPVLRAQRNGVTRVPVGLYARKVWKTGAELLTRGKVLMPGSKGQERQVLRYWLLLDEPGLAKVASRMKAVRDARGALAAAAAGEADGALAPKAKYGKLDPKLSALKEITWLRELPLPVLAINTKAPRGNSRFEHSSP